MRPAGVLLLSLLPLLSSGCYQDMLKATPFGMRDFPVTEGPAEDRIALWPLLYHRAPATSFLWPLGEVTDDSWAFRPFIAVYGERLDILWPFIHIDRADRSGYVLPLVSWKADPQGHIWTLLVGRGTRGDSSRWFYSPFYIQDRAPHASLDVLPPLLTGWGRADGGEESWFGSPLYIELRNRVGVQRFLPLLLTGWGSSEEADWFGSPFYIALRRGEGENVVVPFFFRGWSVGPGEQRILPFLLTGWGSSAEADSSWFASPFYVALRRGEGENVILPFFLTGWSVAPGESFLLSPFYGRFHSGGRTTAFVSPLLSWWTRSADGGWSFDLLLSLFGMSRASDRSSEHVFPFYWRGWHETADAAGRARWLAVMPFYLGSRGQDGFRIDALPFLLSGRTVTPSGNPAWHLLLSLVAWGARPTAPDLPDTRFHRVLPLYYHEREPHRTGFGLLYPLYRQVVEDTGVWSADYLFFLGRVSRSPSRDASRLFPLYTWSRQRVNVEGDPGDEPAAETPRPVEETQFRLLGYLYDRLARRHDDGTEYRRHRVLWRLYHDEAIADTRSIDIFPFITYDRTGQESLTWSWLYRFVRYERRGDEKALYLLFLPAMRWGQGESP